MLLHIENNVHSLDIDTYSSGALKVARQLNIFAPKPFPGS